MNSLPPNQISHVGPLRILALAHEASRSGAPAVHLGWLRWAAERPERFAVHSIVMRRGPLLDEWPATRSLTLLSRMNCGTGLRRWLSERVIDRPFLLRRRFRAACRRICREGVDVVLVNSEASGWLIRELGDVRPPVVLHSHELGSFAKLSVSAADQEHMRQSVARWVAVSEAGRAHLIADYGAAPGQVEVVRNFVKPGGCAQIGRAEARRSLALSAGLPLEADWVVAVGSVDPRKSPESFIEVAARVEEARPGRVCFIWIGGGETSAYGRFLRASSLAENVRFVGARTDVARWMAAADMLLLTSVEDCAPLVVLEAGQAGTPVIAFRGTGGSDEMLEGGAGMLIRERSTQAMAKAVLNWLDHPDDAARAAALARERVRTEADYGRQCEALAEVLDRVHREHRPVSGPPAI